MPLVDEDRKVGKILAKSFSTNVTYGTELRLARSEVHPEERTIEIRVSPIPAGTESERLLIEK